MLNEAILEFDGGNINRFVAEHEFDTKWIGFGFGFGFNTPMNHKPTLSEYTKKDVKKFYKLTY